MADKLEYLISLVGKETVSPAAGKARNSLKRLERDLARAAIVNKKYVESGGKIQATYQDMNVGAKKFNSTMAKAQDITSLSNKQYKHLQKDLDLLEKQYPGVGKRIKGYTHEIRKSGMAIKEIESVQKKNAKTIKIANEKQLEANKIWKAGQRTQDYTRKLITMNGAEYQKLTSRISETGDAQKIANDIREKGHKALSPALKERLAMRVKEIDAVRKAGVTVDANTKKQHEGIMRLNDSLKKYGTRMGAVRRGVEGMFGAVKKAGLVFLTLLGPLFLVGAALRTVKQAADWVYQPFIKFEDALYELRKTANLTKEVMLDIGEAINELSLVIPVAAEELAKIAAIAGRLGIRGRSNILAFTETVAKMSVATVLTAEEAGEALAKIRQAFNLPVENIEYLGSVINELSNTTASNSRDIVAAMRNIGAAGKMIGITADEAAAMSATLVASGMAAERSGCIDIETEVLTKEGWKGIDEISENDSIATRDPKGYLEYKKPQLIYRREWNGDMIHLKTSRADILVTPDHRMLITTPYIDYEKKVEAHSLLKRNRFAIPRTCKWKGKNIKNYHLLKVDYYNNQRQITSTIPSRDIAMDNWCEFMGYFLSEGSISKRGKDYGSIEISQQDGNIKNKIKNNIIKIGFKPNNHKNKGVLISNKQLFKALEEYVNVKARNKYVPSYLKNLDKRYLHKFLEAFIDGDGSRNQDGTKKIFTSSQKLLNDLWEIALKLGYHVSEGIGKSGFGINPLYVLYLGKKKHAFFHKSREAVAKEHYEGRIWCPVLPPYETILIKRHGKVAWTYQTRIRRMLTEMARKSEKMADAMELPTSEMKMAIEKDPMAALLMYLKHLSETESRIDKLKEAHEIFGKVGGFAIATLAENYPELVRNLETASHEIAWGTSLQREFQIATTKTSAELQILTNRSEAARREIGEELVPTLIAAKGITVGFTEALAMASAGLNEITGETDESITAFDVYLNQWDELNTRYMANVDASRSVTTTAREFRKELVMGPDYIRDLSLEMHGLSLTEKEEAEMEIWNNEVRRRSKSSLETLYTSSKKWGDLESNQLKPMKMYNDYLVIRDKWISHIAETEDDEEERAKKIGEVKKLEPILFNKAVDAMIPYMKEKEKMIPLDEKERKALIKLERAQEKGFFTIEKGIKVKGEDADATLDVTKALESLEGITEDYIQDVEELTKSTKELWSGVSGLTGIYDSQYDTYVKLRKMEKGMPRWIKQRIDIYDDEMHIISDLINESKKLRDEKDISGAKEKESLAATKATNLIRDISTEGIEDMNIKQLDLNKHVLDYFNTWIKREGIIPSQIESTEEDFEDMISVFTRGIKNAFEEIPPVDASIGIDVEYFKMSLAELEPVTLKIKPEIEMPTEEEIIGEDTEKDIKGWIENIKEFFRGTSFAGRPLFPEGQHGISRVPETGFYKLHKDESVLTKKEIARNVENKKWNINMGGISLSQNYGFDKLMKDVEEFSLSRL